MYVATFFEGRQGERTEPDMATLDVQLIRLEGREKREKKTLVFLGACHEHFSADLVVFKSANFP